jgi:hypothetical protein
MQRDSHGRFAKVIDVTQGFKGMTEEQIAAYRDTYTALARAVNAAEADVKRVTKGDKG